MTNPRSKGNRGEREVRDVLNAALGAAWIDSRAFDPAAAPPRLDRVPNSGGLRVKGDLYGDTGGVVHVEVKRQERIRLPEWMTQTYGDCPAGATPILVMRQNRERGANAHPLGNWHAVVPLEWAAKHIAREIVDALRDA